MRIAPWLLSGVLLSGDAVGQTSAELNEANNPLTPKLTFFLHNYYVPSTYGLDGGHSDTLLLEGTLPHRLFGFPQLLRTSVPIATSPTPESLTGQEDISIFDLVEFKPGGLQLGIGPMLTFPTATDEVLGAGKWQAGGAMLGVMTHAWGLTGLLTTYQHSFAGDVGRPTQNNLQVQPLLIYNLPAGFYLRSAGILNFNLQNGDYSIPLGIGSGKVWRLPGGTTLNFFVEPQFTVAYQGVAPQWQIFGGMNLQFPLGRK